jgi:hypothetical protein
MSGIDRGRLAEPRHHGPDERETFGPALDVRGSPTPSQPPSFLKAELATIGAPLW